MKEPAVWVKEDGFVRPIPVQLGQSNGGETEVTGGDVHEGMQIVVGRE